MKKYFLIAAVLFFTIDVNAQCNQYFKVQQGTNWTLSNYDAKGKLQGKTKQKVTAYEETSNGFEATFEIVSEDKKGEQTAIGSSKMICEDGVIFFDMNDMFPEEQMQSMEGMEMAVEGTNLELPDNLKVGQQLKDASVVMKIMGPMTMNFKVDIVDRKVIGEETLETPAGTFECFKVSQTVKMKMMMKMEMSSVEYYSKEVGMVKSETYDKKGKLKAYSLLTTYNY